MKCLDENTIEHDNNGKPYKEVAAELCVKINDKYERASFDINYADELDFADYKTYNSPRKYGLSRTGWTVGITRNGYLIRMAPKYISFFNPDTDESQKIHNINCGGLQPDGLAPHAVGLSGDVKFSNRQGGSSQTIIIKSKPLLTNPYGSNCEFAIWTEIEDSDKLKFYCHNMKYNRGEFKAGEWDKITDCEIDNFWMQQDTEENKDLLFFEQVELLPAIEEMVDMPATELEADSEGEKSRIVIRGFDEKLYVILGTKEEFTAWVNIRDLIESGFFGEGIKVTVPMPVVVREALFEQKRLVARNGNLYLVESCPLQFVLNHDYSEPLLLSYTTVSGALGSNTTWTAGTYYASSLVLMGAYNLTLDPDVILKVNTGANYGIGITGTGDLDINGTSALLVYITSKNDDSVGEIILGSDGVPKPGDYYCAAFSNSTTGTVDVDYCITRYAGGSNAFSCWLFNVNNAGKFTFNYCVFEQNASGAVGKAFTGTQTELNNCTIRNSYNLGTAFYAVKATNVYITNLVIIGCSASTSTVMIQLTNPTDSYIRNCYMRLHRNAFGISIITTDNTIEIDNVTIYGATANVAGNYGISLNAGSGTVNVRYSIITGTTIGLQQLGGTLTSDYNNIFANDTNYSGVTPGGNDSQEDAMYYPNFNQDNIFPVMPTTDSPGYGVTTPDKVGDAGYEYLEERTGLFDNTVNVVGGNIIFGYNPKAVIPAAGGATPPSPKYIGV